MKNRSIAFQVWFIITAFVIFISVIMVLTVRLAIDSYFKNITLNNIKISQVNEMGKGNLSSLNSGLESALVINRTDSIKHVLISKKQILEKQSQESLAGTVASDIAGQEGYFGEYVRNYNSFKLFYVVKSFLYNGEPHYLVTIYWDNAQNRIIYYLIKNVIRVITIVLIINITLARFISGSLTAPIRYIEKKVSEIARKEWDTKIELDRKDELGRLADSINMMKDSLKEKDLEEQTFIQTISHDLKTPVMIIRSYVQAIMDKVYINNSFEDTVKVIETEALRLESKIEKLLYLYSFDYIMNNITEYEEVDLKQMISYIVSRVSLLRKEVNIIIEDIPDISVYGSRSDLMQAFENILENNLRYAEAYIRITGRVIEQSSDGEYEPKVEISFSNDGMPIDSTVIKNLFNRYQKGKNGKFGLGLFISKKIVEFHKGEIRAENMNKEVIFRVILPVDQEA